MQFKDAAFEILINSKQPLHYNEITDQALAAGLLDTTGKTPHATMGALLYTDTLNQGSRFRRGDQKGSFALKVTAPTGIEQQTGTIRTEVEEELKTYLKKMKPQKFEELIRVLLEQMGFVETITTPYSGDKGIDVRGVLQVDQLSTMRVAIQAKRWLANVGSDVVQKVRGAVNMTDGEHGIVITPSDFTPSAKTEAQAPGRIPISLVNGEQLVDLLIQYQVGVKQTQYIVPEIDEEYWTEVIGLSPATTPVTVVSGQINDPGEEVEFPLSLQAVHKGKTYTAELLDIKGTVLFENLKYLTPSAAAKAVPTGSKSVNGWDFWRFFDQNTGKWEKLGKLHKTP